MREAVYWPPFVQALTPPPCAYLILVGCHVGRVHVQRGKALTNTWHRSRPCSWIRQHEWSFGLLNLRRHGHGYIAPWCLSAPLEHRTREQQDTGWRAHWLCPRDPWWTGCPALALVGVPCTDDATLHTMAENNSLWRMLLFNGSRSDHASTPQRSPAIKGEPPAATS